MIGTTYVRFQDDVQIENLGQAQDEASRLSKLLFYWVNPLIDKGICGNLKRIDDLFDLPESLSITNNVERLQNAINQTFSLFRSLHRAFGIEFYTIGFLSFFADTLTFAGPLLLAGLLTNGSDDQTGTDIRAYSYAFALFGTAFLGKYENFLSFYIQNKS